MRGLAVSAALLSGIAVAAEVEKPTFEATSIKGAFVEQFTDDWSSRWTPSEATKKTPVGGETFSYVGQWSVEEPATPIIKKDKGLVAKSKAAHHAISAPLATPLNPKGKPFVVQYEVKWQKTSNCGGGYVKLLEEGSLANKEFSDTTPWVVMFGPDLTCPGSKVHFIFRHKNPVTGEVEEKHLKTAPRPVIDTMTKLYTLIVYPDNKYNVLIDDELASEGNLLEDFEPSVNPSKQVDDPTDSKPADWVDEAQIQDPDATKPEDWDEDQPFQVVDEDAVMPEGWLVDEATDIADPDSTKPAEWDDEEDGDWVGPTIKNPKCDEAPGCGPWTKPMKTNPLYKGRWEAPLIDNPAYKGVWAPRKIDNPAYFEDLSPADLRPIGAVGLEIWTMTEDIMFDNIYVGQSPADAKALAATTWHVKHNIEKAEKEAAEAEQKAKAEAEAEKAKVKAEGGAQAVLEALKEDPVGYVRGQVLDFVDDVKEDGPIVAFKANPQVGGAILVSLLTLFGAIGALLGLIGSSSAPVSKSTKKDAPVKKSPTDTPSVAGSEPAAAAAAKTTATASGADTTVKKRK